MPRRIDLNSKEVVDSYKKLKSTLKVGNIFGVSFAKITNVLKKEGIERTGRTLLLNKRKVIKLYRDRKLSTREISKIYNCSRIPILKILKDNNVKIIKRGNNKERPHQGKSYEEYYGKKKAKELKLKIGKSVKEDWSKHSEEKKQGRLKHFIEIRKNLVLPKKDTSIEVKIQNFLKQLGIEFFTHQYMKEIEHGYQCDILIPSMNLVIECDGDYWHKYPIGRDIDHIRTKELIEKGFKVLRLWEFEIRKMKLNDFKAKIQNGH